VLKITNGGIRMGGCECQHQREDAKDVGGWRCLGEVAVVDRE
jgi:hypothetical protein